MNPNKSELTQENIMMALQAILSQRQNQTQSSVVDETMSLFNEQLTEAKQERAETRRVAIEAQKQNAQAMVRQRNAVEALQSQCHHLKPNGRPNTVCQRDHSNNYHYLCQTCSKPWVNGELPAHLAIDPNFIGGPQL